jgi:putative membrane protein
MGWTRNHFDRLVHCMFGVCFRPAIASHALRRYLVVMATLGSLCWAMVYVRRGNGAAPA